MTTEIRVRGSCTKVTAPERAKVHAAIGHEGPAMEPVYREVAGELEAVTASISPLVDDGTVPSWSAGQLRTWSTRPWHKDGRQLPLVHHASVGLTVEFADFAVLSRWVSGQTTSADGFRVANIEWLLTPTHRDELLADIRRRAVADAVTRAQQYADALGLGAVHPVAVGDAGTLHGGDAGVFRPARARAAMMADGAPEMELTPEDIELSAEVDARFHAGL